MQITNEQKMIVEILDDGTVKVETGDLSGPLHQKADEFLAMMAKLLGGEVTITKIGHDHHHHHDHATRKLKQ
jgi:hypothetical protein